MKGVRWRGQNHLKHKVTVCAGEIFRQPNNVTEYKLHNYNFYQLSRITKDERELCEWVEEYESE